MASGLQRGYPLPDGGCCGWLALTLACNGRAGPLWMPAFAGMTKRVGERGNYGDSSPNPQSSHPQWLRESGRGKNRQAIFADARSARFALPHRLYPRTPPSSGRAWTGTANRLSPGAPGAGPGIVARVAVIPDRWADLNQCRYPAFSMDGTNSASFGHSFWRA